MGDKEAAVPQLGRPRWQAGSSLCSEDELSEDPPEAPPWQNPGLTASTHRCLGDTAGPHPALQLLPFGPVPGPTSTRGAGWSWTHDHLRYFHSDKDAYSKRLIPVPSICRVASAGDQKFEVITTRRSFVFRADSDAERKEWVRALQQAVEERRSKALERTAPSWGDASQLVGKSGLLELRGFKHKLFVVVAGDRVLPLQERRGPPPGHRHHLHPDERRQRQGGGAPGLRPHPPPTAPS
ncbi:arf-GAP with Rho-GAP domain, ANK repeat and PH domain-containing protein 1-like, partial [Melanerpes formicivorus]|uniref:arf-GAP with Rho-GAP domain, ANK repeat and PH domain-containing protein 1-like n=1 Tax=Melanerpes formicivorus TaxID=211600 RepID=UPI00358E25E9